MKRQKVFKSRIKRERERETIPERINKIRRREEFIGSRIMLNSLNLCRNERDREDIFCPPQPRAILRFKITNHLPGTPFYRFSRACRIYRRDVCWSMVSGNPSSSDLVTDSSLAQWSSLDATMMIFASISGPRRAARWPRGGSRETHTGSHARVYGVLLLLLKRCSRTRR